MVAAGCRSDRSTTEPLNRRSDLFPGAPEGWSGTPAALHELGRDLTVRRGGAASVYFRSLGQTAFNTSSVLTQTIRADAYRGRRVRYSGFLKADGVIGSGGGLWMRVDGPRGTQALDAMNDRTVGGTVDWRQYEIVLDVPATAIGISYGASFAGGGRINVDDLRLELADQNATPTAPTTPGADPRADSVAIAQSYVRAGLEPRNMDFEGIPVISASAVDWLRQHSVPFATDDPTAPLDDLAPLEAFVGGARVVALGEGTHGTREFFRMKHRMLEFLVERMGFTTFAIEASWPEARDVDHYVRTGDGDPSGLVRGMKFWTWNTDEVVDLVRWMRAYNARAGEPRVRFAGFDMQFPGASIDTVVSTIRRLDGIAAVRVESAYACLSPFRNTSTRAPLPTAYAEQPGAVRAACRDSIEAVSALLAANRAAWAARVGADAYAQVTQDARLVRQWEELAAPDTTDAGVRRDRFMAENVSWVLEHAPAGARIVLWAHNAHVRSLGTSMGGLVRAQYGGDYLAVGLLFGRGRFNAVVFPTSGAPSLGVASLTNVEPTSYEAVFDRLGTPRLMFDARRIASDPNAASLAGPRWMRSIGAGFTQPTGRPGQYYTDTLLPGDYDVLIWFAETTPSRLRP